MPFIILLTKIRFRYLSWSVMEQESDCVTYYLTLLQTKLDLAQAI